MNIDKNAIIAFLKAGLFTREFSYADLVWIAVVVSQMHSHFWISAILAIAYPYFRHQINKYEPAPIPVKSEIPKE